MYHLVYAYFCGESNEKMVGSFMEVVKEFKYHKNVIVQEKFEEGIILHKLLDNFFDTHPAAKESRDRLHIRFQKNSDELIKLYYCHFLARKWNNYSSVPLEFFLSSYLLELKSSMQISVVVARKMLCNYHCDRLASNYTNVKGVLDWMNLFLGRGYRGGQLNMALEDLMENYNLYQADFELFFHDLRIYMDEIKNQLIAVPLEDTYLTYTSYESYKAV